MKSLTSVTIDTGILQRARDNIPNISQFCENALAVHLNIIKKSELDKIPREKLAQITIVDQQARIEELEAEVKRLKEKLPAEPKEEKSKWTQYPTKLVIK